MQETADLTGPTTYADCIAVTASDARFFPFARDLIESLAACGLGALQIGFFDLGLSDGQRAWLNDRGVLLRTPVSGLSHDPALASDLAKTSVLARPFLRENFPGYALYLWLDADTWLQEASAIEALTQGARRHGAAVVHQRERAYRFWPWLIAWQFKHFTRGFGGVAGVRLGLLPHVNAGVFAMTREAPHWDRWRAHYQRAIDRTGLIAPHDQFALNAAVHLDRLPTAFLPATCNWICDLGTPMWDEATRRFCTPYPPHAPIGLLHLAGPAKTNDFAIRTTAGGLRHGTLRYAAARAFAAP